MALIHFTRPCCSTLPFTTLSNLLAFFAASASGSSKRPFFIPMSIRFTTTSSLTNWVGSDSMASWISLECFSRALWLKFDPMLYRRHLKVKNTCISFTGSHRVQLATVAVRASVQEIKRLLSYIQFNNLHSLTSTLPKLRADKPHNLLSYITEIKESTVTDK